VGGGSYTFVASETPLPETEPVETEPVETEPTDTTIPADADTNAPTDTTPETKPAKKGCGSSLGLTAVAPFAAAPLLLAKKKKRRA
jgi:hypothetical protein